MPDRLKPLSGSSSSKLDDSLGSVSSINGKLSIALDSVDGGELVVDFYSSRFIHRVKTTGGKSELAKACSLKSSASQSRLNILDLTAGLGTDSVMLACLGANVTLVERDPAVHAILLDGLSRATSDSYLECLSFDPQSKSIARRIHQAVSGHINLLPRQDSYAYLTSCQPDTYDCIYFDPMFPERKKAAKVKLAMQVFHQLVGFDFEQDEKMLSMALTKAKKRVVVKRSKQADFIGGRKPSYSLKLKALRYDI
ncbi:MAG: class I SAM-dependent methyltransferase, partial [Sinobacterium sp.]|nr:class I SAM-dependent methyltransferase [Sinobacterium sp.]